MSETDWLDIDLEDDDVLVITTQVCVTQYLTESGSRFCVTTKGTANISTMLGLLTTAQHDLLLENDQASADED